METRELSKSQSDIQWTYFESTFSNCFVLDDAFDCLNLKFDSLGCENKILDFMSQSAKKLLQHLFKPTVYNIHNSIKSNVSVT